MKIVNLTPHALHIRRTDGTDITIEPSGIVPRLEVSREACAPVTCEDGVEIAVSRATFGALTCMPPVSRSCTACSITEDEARDGSQPRNMACEDGFAHQFVTDAIFVVSALCAQSPELAGRNDVYAPGEALRDGAGKIIGATGLSRINPLAGAR
jgi:hypothetical protein